MSGMLYSWAPLLLLDCAAIGTMRKMIIVFHIIFFIAIFDLACNILYVLEGEIEMV